MNKQSKLVNVAQSGNLFTFRADSVADLVATAGARVNGAEWIHERWGDSHRGDWFGAGATTGADCIRIVREGSDSLTAGLTAAAISLPTVRPMSNRRKPTWRDAGDEFNVERALRWQLETWRCAPRLPRPGAPRIVIAVDSWITWRETSDSLRFRGAAVALAAQRAVAAGLSVQVVNAFSAQRWTTSGDVAVLATIVKGYSAPLNMSSLAAAVAFPGTPRYLIWCALANHFMESFSRASNGHAGSQRDVKPDEIRTALGDQSAHVVLATRDVMDAQSAQNWLATFGATVDSILNQRGAA